MGCVIESFKLKIKIQSFYYLFDIPHFYLFIIKLLEKFNLVIFGSSNLKSSSNISRLPPVPSRTGGSPEVGTWKTSTRLEAGSYLVILIRKHKRGASILIINLPSALACTCSRTPVLLFKGVEFMM